MPKSSKDHAEDVLADTMKAMYRGTTRHLSRQEAVAAALQGVIAANLLFDDRDNTATLLETAARTVRAGDFGYLEEQIKRAVLDKRPEPKFGLRPRKG